MKETKKVMAMPAACFWAVVVVCALGIAVGSIYDFPINETLAKKTEIGAFFATYGSYFSYCLYPAAGACLFVGLRKKGGRFDALAWTLLVLGWFLAVYYSNSYNGKAVRALFGYTAGKLADDSDPDKLIAVGAAILVAGIVADNVNLWLKQVGSRPRYKYLITLDDPVSEFRQWWQMVPNLAGSNDNFKSWPSGNMTIASMMFSLPMLTDCFKSRSEGKNRVAFLAACAFVLLYGYNRIHMTNHFLTDVCFGTLITYCIYAGISTAFLRATEK